MTARCARLLRHRFSARREQVPPRGADVRAAQLREVHDAGEEEAVRVEAPRHALCVFNKVILNDIFAEGSQKIFFCQIFPLHYHQLLLVMSFPGPSYPRVVVKYELVIFIVC